MERARVLGSPSVTRHRGYGGRVGIDPGGAVRPQPVRADERAVGDQPPVAYFDTATAAPLHPVARQALVAALDDGWADPTKLYQQARRARQLLEAARGAAAEAVGCRPEELTFTPGGADACGRAVAGLLRGRRRAGDTFVHTAVEHSSVLHAAQTHVSGGGRAVSVPVDRLGSVRLPEYRDAVRAPGVAATAVMSANHEVGTLQPLEDVVAISAESGVPLLVDAAQSLGRMPVPGGW